MFATQIIEKLKGLLNTDSIPESYKEETHPHFQFLVDGVNNLITEFEDKAKEAEEKLKLILHNSEDYVKIELGKDYIEKIGKVLFKLYPEITMTKEFFKINEDNNLLGRACKLIPSQERGEVFLIVKKFEEDAEKVEYYLYKKLYNEVSQYILDNTIPNEAASQEEIHPSPEAQSATIGDTNEPKPV